MRSVTHVALFCSLLTLGLAPAFAAKRDDIHDVATSVPGLCPVGTYQFVKRNVDAVISNVAGEVCAPAIEFWDQPGAMITDVVVDLDIEHTWIGDLTITLCHIPDTGGVQCVDLLQRPGVPQTTFGCSADLVSDPENKYYFSSRPDLEPMGEADCPSAIPAGCYAPAVENTFGFEAFHGTLIGDGSWTLCVTDSAGEDDGFLHNWSMHVLTDSPVGVGTASWGKVKAGYR